MSHRDPVIEALQENMRVQIRYWMRMFREAGDEAARVRARENVALIEERMKEFDDVRE